MREMDEKTFPAYIVIMSDKPLLVTFLPEDKIILVNTGVLALSVEQDIYFAWKNWASQDNNSGYLPALEWTWGLPDTYGIMVPIFYLINGWKLRTWEGEHTLLIDGAIYTQSGEAIFVPTVTYHHIIIKFKNSIIEKNMLDYNRTLDTYVTLMSAVSAKVDTLLDINEKQSLLIHDISTKHIAHEAVLAKLENLIYQILGLSKSNFKIINPQYKDNGVMTSTIQTFKSREDMINGIVLKSYSMKTDYDEQGRLQQFRIMEKAMKTPPISPNHDMSTM